MATEGVTPAEATGASSTEPQPAVPDFMTDPNAVLKDVNAKWRYGRPPDYSKTRKWFAASKYPTFSLVATCVMNRLLPGCCVPRAQPPCSRLALAT